MTDLPHNGPSVHQQALKLNDDLFNDQTAAEYDKKAWVPDMKKASSEALLNFSYSDGPVFTKDKRLLDFACGTGLVTEVLFPHVKSVTGIDINASLLKYFHQRFGDAAGILLDVLDPQQDHVVQSLAESFDIVTCTYSYHHLGDYESITKKLALFLSTSGVLMVFDLYNPDAELSETNRVSVSHASKHMGGLKVEALRLTLLKAGLKDVVVDNSFKTKLWHELKFIEGHCPQDVFEKVQSGEVPSKSFNGKTVYLIEVNMVLAVGRK